MSGISRAELTNLPHLNVPALGDRAILLMPVWDGESWTLWIDGPDGKLIKMNPLNTTQSHYLAHEPAGPDDIWIGFVEFMWQRASWPQISRFINGICDDFHLMATSAAKLEHFHRNRDSIDGLLLSSFVKTEIEYLIVVARSVFDLLQEIVAHFWNDRVKLFDAAAEATHRKHKLPRDFTKVVLNDEVPRTALAISERYALPVAVAEAYAKHASFFASLRASRNGIIHDGSSVDAVFATEKGFCVSPNSNHYGDFPWKDEHYFNPNIVSLRPWIARTVCQTIEACSEVIYAFAGVIPFPEEAAPGYRVFLRDSSNRSFVRLLDAAAGNLIWWEEGADGPPPRPGS